MDKTNDCKLKKSPGTGSKIPIPVIANRFPFNEMPRPLHKFNLDTARDTDVVPDEIFAPVDVKPLPFDELPIAQRTTSIDYQLSSISQLSPVVETNAKPNTRKFKSTVTKVTAKLKTKKSEAPAKKKIVAACELKSFDKPAEAYKNMWNQLENKDWDLVILGLDSMKRFVNKHPEIIQNEIQQLCFKLRDLVTNLRSQVTRAASQAASQLFLDYTKKPKQQLQLEKSSDSLVDALFQRCVDSNRYISGDAEIALKAMSEGFSTIKVLNTISKRASKHKDAIVRTMAATLLLRLAERLGCQRIYALRSEHRDVFFMVGANLLREGNPKMRELAKNIFNILSNDANYKQLVTKIIPIETYAQIEKHLKLIT